MYNKNKINLADYIDQITLVDFFPGSHGHVLIETLHEILSNHWVLDSVLQNYHTSPLVPPLIYTPDKLCLPLNLLEMHVNDNVYRLLETNQKIFWPVHWSNHWEYIDNTNLANYIKGFDIIEIYVDDLSLTQYFVNAIINVFGNTKAKDSNYFVENFSDIAKISGFASTMSFVEDKIPLTFTQEEVVTALVNCYNYRFNKQESLRNTCLSLLPNTIYSVRMSEFYNLDCFVKLINDLLPGNDINDNYLANKWNQLMQKQMLNRYNNKLIPDDQLHPIELATRKYMYNQGLV